MPNWTSNRIAVEGETADIRAFPEAVKWEHELFEFNRIIPMPELLKHTASASTVIDGKKVTSWYVINPWDKDSPAQERLFTPEEEAELASIGHRDWYSWSVTNWGTKWSACRVEIDDTSVEHNYLEIHFETAWSPPEPVFRKMISLFPKLTFDFRWRYEEDDPFPHSLDDEPDPSPVSAVIANVLGGPT